MPTPHDVIAACLAQPLPCPVCGHLEVCRCVRPDDYSPTHERATLIELALQEYGYLPRPDAEPTIADMEEAARFLARRSGHLRYTGDDDEWRTVLASKMDVEMAYHQASKAGPDDALVKARALLLDGFTTGLLPQAVTP